MEESGVQEGLCVICIPHTTAGLTITSFWDPRGLDDLLDEIDRNIPTRVSYKHQDSPYDASGHVKSAMIGSSASLIISGGKLILGSSQGPLRSSGSSSPTSLSWSTTAPGPVSSTWRSSKSP